MRINEQAKKSTEKMTCMKHNYNMLYLRKENKQYSKKIPMLSAGSKGMLKKIV